MKSTLFLISVFLFASNAQAHSIRCVPNPRMINTHPYEPKGFAVSFEFSMNSSEPDELTLYSLNENREFVKFPELQILSIGNEGALVDGMWRRSVKSLIAGKPVSISIYYSSGLGETGAFRKADSGFGRIAFDNFPVEGRGSRGIYIYKYLLCDRLN